MISRIFRYLFSLAAVVVAAVVVIHRAEYTSLIPESFNPMNIISTQRQGDAAEVAPQPLESTPVDTLERELIIDSLQQDTIKIEKN